MFQARKGRADGGSRRKDSPSSRSSLENLESIPRSSLLQFDAIILEHFFRGDVVLDSLNMKFRDEGSILDPKYKKTNILGSL